MTAWTDPVTWATLDAVTAPLLNEQLRDNMGFLRVLHGCSLTRAADQSIADATDVAVSWPQEDYNSEGASLHSTSTNNSRIKVPTGFDGVWRVQCSILWAGDNTGIRQVWLQKNGTDVVAGVQNVPPSASALSQTLVRDLALDAGDYVEFMVRQTSGGALAVTAQGTQFGGAAAATSWATAAYLGS